MLCKTIDQVRQLTAKLPPLNIFEALNSHGSIFLISPTLNPKPRTLNSE
jgi:hypothetical protein